MSTTTEEVVTCTEKNCGRTMAAQAETGRATIYRCQRGHMLRVPKESGPTPRARNTDPVTSHEAAAKIAKTPAALNDKRRAVLKCVAVIHTCEGSDESIAWTYIEHMSERGWPKQSPSGLRTRRKELVDMGMMENTGRTTTTKGGGKTIVWGLTPKGRQALK